MIKKNVVFSLLLFFMAFFILPTLIGGGEAQKDLSLRYEKWVEEEVVYIITPMERDVFLSFQKDRDRDLFIRAFWKQRDPNKDTPDNEYKIEHYERLNYANKYFGRATTRSGCLTDRGRIYIILGAPQDIDRYPGLKNIHPTEIWFYAGTGKNNLPAAFNIVFFKRRGIGEYILYSPIADGPYELFYKYEGDPVNLEAIYRKLREQEPGLANYVLSLIPGEQTYAGHPSMASENMLMDIKNIPQKEVKDNYAEALLKNKELIEVEYSANYIESNMISFVSRDEKGRFFFHYSIEPETLSVGNTTDSFYANFSINGIFSDESGEIVFQFGKEFPLKLGKDQIKAITGTTMAIQDMVPIIPGNYKFSLLIKNTTSKEFSSQEQRVSVAQPSDFPHLSRILLGFSTENASPSEKSKKPFNIGPVCYHTSFQALFDRSDDLHVGFQILGIRPDLMKDHSIKIEIAQDSNSLMKKELPLDDSNSGINIHESFSLSELNPGYYKTVVSLVNEKGETVLADSEGFAVSQHSKAPKPIIFSSKYPADSPEYFYILGNQYFRVGDLNHL